jgi:hypothetical protein
VSRSFVRHLVRTWNGKLSFYRQHRNDEHLLAVIEEASRYVGLHLENDLAASEYWSELPLIRRAGVLLFLADQGIVDRTFRNGRRVFAPLPQAETWVQAQPTLRAYSKPILELITALRHELQRRAHSSRS